MLPAMLDGSWGDTLPCPLCHHHCLQNISLVNILLFSFVLLNSAESKLVLVVCLEGVDNPGIKGLDMGGEARLKVDKSYTLWLIFNFVA